MSVVKRALKRKEGVVTVGDGWDQIFSQFERDFFTRRNVGKWFYHTKYRNFYGIRANMNHSFRRGKKIANICLIAPRRRPMQVERTSKSPPLISVPKLLVKMLMAQSPNSLFILSMFDDYSWIINS